MSAPGVFIHLVAVGQDLFLAAVMTIIRRNKTNRTVKVLGVVPDDKFIDPGFVPARCFQKAVTDTQDDISWF